MTNKKFHVATDPVPHTSAGAFGDGRCRMTALVKNGALNLNRFFKKRDTGWPARATENEKTVAHCRGK